MTSNQICKQCNKPRVSSSSGSITQWVSVCTCNLGELEGIPDSTINLCVTCGKRIGEGRQGSITQFVFRSELCSCTTPKPIQKQESSSQNIEGKSLPLDDREEIDKALAKSLDPEAFPIERYKPYELLGKGSYGSVYSCLDTKLDKKVAVKILNSLNSEQLVKFQTEAIATSKLNHPGIVNILDFGSTSSGSPYMVLEFIRGKRLDTYLKEEGKLHYSSCITILMSLLESLSYANKNGIFHRDIKPSNIILTESDDMESPVKLIDFGIAHFIDRNKNQNASNASEISGTPRYMSPDLASGKEYSQRSEIYSVACVLYECLTGEVPFDAKTASQIIYKKANERPRQIELNSDDPDESLLVDIIYKCLDNKPDNRYQTIDEILDKFESSQPEDDFLTAPHLPKEKVNSHKLSLVVIMLSIFSVLGLSYFVFNNLFNQNVKETSGKKKNRAKKSKKQTVSPFLRPESHQLWILRKTPNNDTAACIYGVPFKLEHLKQFPKAANSVWLYECQLNNPKALLALGKLPNLQSVYIHFCQVDNESFDSLATGLDSHKNTRFLSLVKTPLSLNIYRRINKMTYLKSFTVQDTNFTDNSLKHLANNRFVDVKIRFTQISDKSIDNLIKWKHMKKLAVSNNLITKPGLERFEKQRKDCRVYIVQGDDQVVGPKEYSNILDELNIN